MMLSTACVLTTSSWIFMKMGTLWIAAGQHQRGLFVEAKHQIEVLNCLSGGSFDQVVDGDKHDYRVAARRPADVDEICVLYPINIGRIVNKPDKELFGIELSEKLADMVSRNRFWGRDID